MATRYCGDLKIEIKYVGESDDRRSVYAGRVSCPKYSWAFKDLCSGVGGVSSGKGYAYASDSIEAYDEMARSAVGFATYYTTDNRDPDDDGLGGFPTADQADAFSEAAMIGMGEDDYEIRRRRDSLATY